MYIHVVQVRKAKQVKARNKEGRIKSCKASKFMQRYAKNEKE